MKTKSDNSCKQVYLSFTYKAFQTILLKKKKLIYYLTCFIHKHGEALLNTPVFF